MFAGHGPEPIMIIKQRASKVDDFMSKGYEQMLQQGFIQSPKNQFSLSKCVNVILFFSLTLKARADVSH